MLVIISKVFNLKVVIIIEYRYSYYYYLLLHKYSMVIIYIGPIEAKVRQFIVGDVMGRQWDPIIYKSHQIRSGTRNSFAKAR